MFTLTGWHHSEETKKKISEATKGRVPHNKGKKEAVKHIYYTDGKTNIRIPITQKPPEGFTRGKTRKKLSEKSKEQFVKNLRQTCLERYGDPTYNNMEKNKQTKLERYGNEKYNNREKASQTCIEKYGGVNPGVDEKVKEKIYLTKKTNKSFSISKPEDLYYSYLCEKYGADDIVRQYKEARYPFMCDFYIKSMDTFIELNLYWSHGEHPFNSNSQEDLEKLSIWKERAGENPNSAYTQAITVWTVKDPLKIKTAKENNLNYIMYYSKDELPI